MDVHWLSHFYVLQIFVVLVLASSALSQRERLSEFRFFYHKEEEYFLHTFIFAPVQLIQHQSCCTVGLLFAMVWLSLLSSADAKKVLCLPCWHYSFGLKDWTVRIQRNPVQLGFHI